MRRLSTAVAMITGIAAFALGVTPAAQAEPGPETNSFVTALIYSISHPSASPQGANDWSCRPSARHPRPVVLVHGTYENRYNNFARLSPALKRDGYCVFALNYGATEGNPPFVKGSGDIRLSAKELALFVDAVLAVTRSSTVDIVGHSQGGLMPRQYLKFEGGASKVTNLVGLGPSNHGTTFSGIATLIKHLGLLGIVQPLFGVAVAQQITGSAFLATLNAGGETVPGVRYTNIATRFDEISTPYRTAFLTAGPGATVTNITLQRGCPIDFSDHLSMSYSPRAIGYVRRALDPTAPAPPCLPNPPVV